LTQRRSKPAVPFGGRYRIVDFVLSNLVNSGIHATFVLTQYKAQSLLEHLQRAWVGQLGRDVFITPVPAQMQTGTSWYQGNADAIYQNLNLIQDYRPSLVIVFGADHIYKMDIRQMIKFHEKQRSRCTVACIPVPVAEAKAFGIIEVDNDWRVTGFEEKPTEAREIPGRPGFALASMGNYLFDPALLTDVLSIDADSDSSEHDFGSSIFPKLFQSERIFAYDFHKNRIPGESKKGSIYWRDVGTIDTYYEANMDLRAVCPALNLYNWDWPIQTASFKDPPAKFVFDHPSLRGMAVQSIVGSGTIVAGGTVTSSVVGRNVRVETGAVIEDSILMDNVIVGEGATVRGAILDKNVTVAEGAVIGGDDYEISGDEARSEQGIVVVPKEPESPASLARDH